MENTINKERVELSRQLLVPDYHFQIECVTLPELCERLRMACKHGFPWAFEATIEAYFN